MLLQAGAARVVVGTAAFAGRDALRVFAEALGDRLVVAIDVRNGLVAVRGWQVQTSLGPEEAAARCAAAGVSRLLCTAVERDGTLAGPDVGLLERVRESSSLPVLAAGGIATRAHIEAVQATGCEAAIVGRALLEEVLPLALVGATR
jgi:phosphoribosylformimino-5-aminoimidazole carboxamide ribotide isomerase